MRIITQAPNLNGKRVLVRVDWSVPDLKSDYQIRVSLPTIEFLRQAGAKIILATHLERGNVDALLPRVPEGVALLPNLRENPGEEANSEEFARELASKADIYVNEAFPVSHRKHASIVGVPKFLPSYAGIQFLKEVEELSKSFNPPHPFLFILGGAKFETKAPLVQKFLNIADEIFIGGTNAVPAYATELKNNPKIFFPHGDIAALDVDEATLENLKLKIGNSKFILWNGPVGKYEDGHKKGTLEIAKMLATCGTSTSLSAGKQVIVGGGDTLAAIDELNLYDKFSFVSTGGGAMLDFLAHGTLPGIEALK
jgi:phosphoglycerate kinase